jgi:hypothetical protein
MKKTKKMKKKKTKKKKPKSLLSQPTSGAFDALRDIPSEAADLGTAGGVLSRVLGLADSAAPAEGQAPVAVASVPALPAAAVDGRAAVLGAAALAAELARPADAPAAFRALFVVLSAGVAPEDLHADAELAASIAARFPQAVFVGSEARLSVDNGWGLTRGLRSGTSSGSA